MRELIETRRGKLLGHLYDVQDGGSLLHIKRGRIDAIFDVRSGRCLATGAADVVEIIRVTTRAAEVA